MTAPTKARTLEDLQGLDNGNEATSLDAALYLLSGDFRSASWAAWLVNSREDAPTFVEIMAGVYLTTSEELEIGADFALRDLLTEYPGLRALCVQLPEGMTMEWEEDVE